MDSTGSIGYVMRWRLQRRAREMEFSLVGKRKAKVRIKASMDELDIDGWWAE
jgi:hypothetical protein